MSSVSWTLWAKLEERGLVQREQRFDSAGGRSAS